MLKIIACTELRLLWADRGAAASLLIFVLLAGCALLHGSHEARRRSSIAQQLADAENEQLARARAEAHAIELRMAAEGKPLGEFTWGPRHPYRVGSSLGARAALPAGPLAALALGQSDLQPSDYRVTAASSMALSTTDQLENPLKLLVGHFDLAFVVLYLLPLLILALGYNLISADREEGTLELLLAQPLSLGRLVAGKVAARALVLLGAAAGLSLLGFLTSGAVAEQEARLAVWLLATLLYGAFWFALTLAVTSLGRPSVTNAVILAACWLALVVVIPSVVNVTAARLYPVPPRVEFITAIRSASAEAELERSATLARYFEDHPELAPVADDDANFAMLRVASDERVAAALAPVVARYESQRARQQVLIRRIGYLSPTLFTHAALLDAAGTGDARHQRFLAQVKLFQRQWHDEFAPRYFAKQPFRPSDYDRLPRFAYVEERPGAVAGRVLGPLLLLVASTLVLAALGARSYRRFPVVG